MNKSNSVIGRTGMLWNPVSSMSVSGDDCLCIAVSLVMRWPYTAIAAQIDFVALRKRRNKWAADIESAATGVSPYTASKYLKSLGFEYVSLVDKNNKVTTKVKDAPLGRLIARTTGHVSAVINRVVNDTADTREDYMYGFWVRGLKRKVISKGDALWYVLEQFDGAYFAVRTLLDGECFVSNWIYLHHVLKPNGTYELMYLEK